MIGALLRIYSYLYHAALSLLLMGVSLVAMGSQSHTLKLDILPWKGAALTHWLLGMGAVGLLSVLLAVTGKLRILFVFYALAVAGLMFRGYFLTGYGFSGKDEFRFALMLTGGAVFALFGAISRPRKKR